MSQPTKKENSKSITLEKEKMAKKTKPEKKTVYKQPSLYWRLAVAAILGIFLTGGVFLVLNQLKSLVKEIEVKRGQLVALSTNEETYQELSAALESVKEEAVFLAKVLPDEETIIDFIGRVEEIARESEVEVSSLRFNQETPRKDDQGCFFLELGIQTKGSILNLDRFLEKMNQEPFLLKPKTIAVSNLDEAVSEMVYSGWLYVDPIFFKKP